MSSIDLGGIDEGSQHGHDGNEQYPQAMIKSQVLNTKSL